MNQKLFVLGLSLIFALCLFTQCDEDEPETSNFVGTYDISFTHISGLQDSYDSVGNQLGFIIDTTFLENIEIEISELGFDSLTVSGLLTGWNNNPFDDLSFFISDNPLVIDFDESTLTRNNYIRGEINLIADSLFIDYRWDRSDIWSTGATPVYGEYSGTGIKR